MSTVREEKGKEVAPAHSKSTYESSSCRTFKNANMHSLVQSCELVYLSGLHCHMRASSTSGRAFVYFIVQYCMEYSIFLPSPGCPEASVKASLMYPVLLRSTRNGRPRKRKKRDKRTKYLKNWSDSWCRKWQGGPPLFGPPPLFEEALWFMGSQRVGHDWALSDWTES